MEMRKCLELKETDKSCKRAVKIRKLRYRNGMTCVTEWGQMPRKGNELSEGHILQRKTLSKV